MTSGPVVRKPLLVGGVACYAVVFALFSVAERPGLGIGHGYYVAIALVALASNALGGAAAGLLATLLYAAGMYVTPRVPVANIATVATVIRLVTYVTVGTVIGHYAARSRTLIVRAEELMEELRLLAARDVVTGLPNQRSFEQAVNSRIAAGAPFALVLCDLPGEPVPVPLVDRVLAFSEQLPAPSTPRPTWRASATTSSPCSRRSTTCAAPACWPGGSRTRCCGPRSRRRRGGRASRATRRTRSASSRSRASGSTRGASPTAGCRTP
jgi:hypothetical protein